MNELSLFSGAGGGLLASKYLLGWRTIGYLMGAKRYRRRTRSFRAIQYNGFNYDSVFKFMGVTKLPEPFHTFENGMLTFRPNVPIPVVTSLGIETAKTNDYIVRDGGFSVCNPIDFELRYEEAP